MSSLYYYYYYFMTSNNIQYQFQFTVTIKTNKVSELNPVLFFFKLRLESPLFVAQWGNCAIYSGKRSHWSFVSISYVAL